MNPSPNFDSREGQNIDMLVLHYTDMATAKEALEKLCDPAAKVSAHYLVEEDGTVHALVPEEMRAWHAGVSSWRGHTNINQRSIGIEIANPGHRLGYRPFPKPQMEAVAKLCRNILSRHDIPARNVVAHSDVAPTRKKDPGELFDWKGLAEQGVGLWPNEFLIKTSLAETLFSFLKMLWRNWAGSCFGASRLNVTEENNHLLDSVIRSYSNGNLQIKLADYGYNISDLPKAIAAFQRHFRPKSLTGQWDNECAALLASLLAQV